MNFFRRTTKVHPAPSQQNLSELEIVRNRNITRNENFFALLFPSNEKEQEIIPVVTRRREKKTITEIIPVPARRNKQTCLESITTTVVCPYCSWKSDIDNVTDYSYNHFLRGHLQNNKICKDRRNKNDSANFLIPYVDNHIVKTDTCIILQYNFNPSTKKPDYNLDELENICTDDFCNEEFLDGNDEEEKFERDNENFFSLHKPELVSQVVHQHQKALIEDYNRVLQIRGGKLQDDILEIYSWSVGMSVSLSEREGNDLLAVIKRMLLRRQIEEEDCRIHSSWKRLALCCNKNVKHLNPIKKFSIPLPQKYFGTVDLQSKPLLKTECVVFDILKRIGDYLVKIKHPDMFATEAIIRESVTGERLYGDFRSGEFFEAADKLVKAEHGNNAVALCLHFSMDGTGCNASGSIQKCPLTFIVGNAVQYDAHATLIGYVNEALPYDDEYLHALLIKRKCLVAKDRENIIKAAKNQLIYDYVYAAIEPILQHQQYGLLVTIGQGSYYTFFLFFNVYKKIIFINYFYLKTRF